MQSCQLHTETEQAPGLAVPAGGARLPASARAAGLPLLRGGAPPGGDRSAVPGVRAGSDRAPIVTAH